METHLMAHKLEYFIVWKWFGAPWAVHGPFPTPEAAEDEVGKTGNWEKYTYEIQSNRQLR